MSSGFYVEFQASRDRIESLIQSVASQSDKDSCLKQIQELSDKCKTILYSLPEHDQKLYSTQLKDLQDQIGRVSFKPKFGFSTKVDLKTRPSVEAREVASKPLEASSSGLRLSGLKTSTYHDIPGSHTSFSLDSIDSSIVVLRTAYLTGKIDNVSNSIIVLTRVDGPVYVNKMDHCILVVASHQLRIHKSHDLDIYVSCRRPIIEGCKQMRFGPFPQQLADQPVVQYETVDDFNWLKKSPSENWAVLQKPEPNWMELMSTEANVSKWL